MLNIRKDSSPPSSRSRQNIVPPYPRLMHTSSQQFPSAHEGVDSDARRQRLCDLEKILDEKLRSKGIYDLRYDKLCLLSKVDLPPGYIVLMFNMFDGRGDPIIHLMDYCGKLVGIGHNKALLMRLFVQSLSGMALTWFAQQDFDKWHNWEALAQDL